VEPLVASIAIVYGLAAFATASWVHGRWFGRRPGGATFYDVYLLVLAFASACGWLAFGLPARDWSALALIAIPAGAVAGQAAVVADRAIVRTLVRRAVVGTPGGPGGARRPRGPALDPQARSLVMPARRAPRSSKVALIFRKARMSRAATGEQTLAALVGLAILEELVYRDVLLRASLALPGVVLDALALAGTLIAFALAHVDHGWPHVLAKLPLGALCLLLVLASSSVLPAIATHLVFNVRAWHDRRPLDASRASPQRVRAAA